MPRKTTSTGLSLVLAGAAIAASCAVLAATGPVSTDRKARVVMGPTYPITEPDLLTEIERRAAAAQPKFEAMVRSKAPESHSGFQSVPLPAATKDESRLFDPTYTLPHDIRNDKGEVLYPAGTKVNPYTKVRMPGRFIVIGPNQKDFEWLDQVAKPVDADKILLAGGNVAVVRRTRRKNVFVLDERGVERLGLRAVPAIVQQEGLMLRVTEYALK